MMGGGVGVFVFDNVLEKKPRRAKEVFIFFDKRRGENV